MKLRTMFDIPPADCRWYCTDPIECEGVWLWVPVYLQYIED